MKTFAIVVETEWGEYRGIGYLHCTVGSLLKIISDAGLDAELSYDDDDMVFLTSDEVSSFKKSVHSHNFQITKFNSEL